MIGAGSDVFDQESAVPVIGQTGEVHRTLFVDGRIVERGIDPVEHDDGLGIKRFLEGVFDYPADGQGIDLRAGGEDVFEVRNGSTFVVVSHRVAEVERVSGIGQ